MSTSTSTAANATNLDQVSQIAGLLSGGEETGDQGAATPETDTEQQPDLNDSDAALGEPDESTVNVDDVPESDELETDDPDDEEQEPEGEPAPELEPEEYQGIIADAFGVEPRNIVVDADGNVSLKVKVDGQESTHSMDDLIAGFQYKKHNDLKSQALVEERKKFEAVAEQQLTQYQEALTYGANMVKTLQQEFMAEYKGVDWDDLRTMEPARYAAMRIDFDKRYQQLKAMGTMVGTKQQTLDGEAKKKQQASRNEYMLAERDKMLSNNPTWVDKTTLKQDMSTLRTFLSDTYGFTPKNLDHVEDARLIEVAKDAMAHRKGAKVAQKKIKFNPKRQKAGRGGKGKKVSKVDRLTQAAKQASGGRKRDLQTEAVAALLTGE